MLTTLEKLAEKIAPAQINNNNISKTSLVNNNNISNINANNKPLKNGKSPLDGNANRVHPYAKQPSSPNSVNSNK